MRVSLLTAASQALKQALTHAGVLESAVGRRKWKVCCKTEVSELCRVMEETDTAEGAADNLICVSTCSIQGQEVIEQVERGQWLFTTTDRKKANKIGGRNVGYFSLLLTFPHTLFPK